MVTEDKNDHTKDQGGMLKYIKSLFIQMAHKKQGRTTTWQINIEGSQFLNMNRIFISSGTV